MLTQPVQDAHTHQQLAALDIFVSAGCYTRLEQVIRGAPDEVDQAPVAPGTLIGELHRRLALTGSYEPGVQGIDVDQSDGITPGRRA